MHTDARVHGQPSRDTTAPADPPYCPLCNGPLVPLRGCYRCARCCFSICLGCEAPDAGSADPGE